MTAAGTRRPSLSEQFLGRLAGTTANTAATRPKISTANRPAPSGSVTHGADDAHDAGQKRTSERVTRLTVRARLTLTYSALFTAAGAVMLSLIYVFMRYVPTYAISPDQGAVMAARQSMAGVTATTPVEGFASTLDTVGTTASDTVQGVQAVGQSMPVSLLLTDQTDILNTLLVASGIMLVVLAVASSWAGWIISGRVLRPLQEINVAAQRAAAGSFDHRVALVGPRDEITELSDTFDHMLERLDRSFHTHRRFAANASHELRTPLATTQAMIDVAVRDDELDADGLREVLQRLRLMNDRSIETVEALLDLADLGQRELRVEAVNLADLVEDAVLDVADDAVARDIRVIENVVPMSVLGEPRLVAQVASNLLNNAVRHNHDGGTITVSTSRDASGAPRLTVSNTGSVIPAAALPMLVEPFYRDRGRLAEGPNRSRGLGLAIVDSIVAAHDGTLMMRANPSGGLSVTVTFGVRKRAVGGGVGPADGLGAAGSAKVLARV
ncbi:ATP-binding protein [Plantibacter sp. Mn2098]|uniref:HAMP domain-containing sensor histidine kinase n=1 Tax=Plantibacter sp. Mn2098 TaxID=3395266 RepID=UPI003BBA509A